MFAPFLSPLLFAFLWSTLGCMWVRYKWGASYDTLCVLWLMTVFGFTLVNMVFFFSWFAWPSSLFLSASALFAPAIAYFGFFRTMTNLDDEKPRWGKFVYGGLLIASASTMAVYSNRFLTDLLRISNHMIGAPELAGFLFVVLVVGLSGVMAIVRDK